MKNITLSVDEKVLAAARRHAAKHNTTVNGIVREHLEQIARNEDHWQKAAKRLRKLSENSRARIGPIDWTRDDLHGR
jgi:uncharacterized protein DUF6364